LFGKQSNESSAPPLTEARVLEALAKIEDPDLHKDIVSLDFVKDLEIRDGEVSFRIELTTPACPVKEQFRHEATSLVAAIPGVKKVSVEMSANVAGSNPLLAQNAVPGIKNILAVSSGKGGVGKSTVAVNLACALQQSGASVGILDADVYGPNIPLMLGIEGRPEAVNDKIAPLRVHGLSVMSMAFLVAEDQPVIWRGPMLHGAIRQFLQDVDWGELDYLVVDLPPGTGDAQLSLAQQTHLMGALIVTTPQDVSVLDVKKAIRMFQQVNVPVLGVVENMAGFELRGRVAGGPGSVEIEGPEGPIRTETDEDGRFSLVLDLFGAGGGAKISERFGIPVLGRIPLDPSVRSGGDSGSPVVLDNPGGEVARSFLAVAGSVASRVSTVNLS